MKEKTTKKPTSEKGWADYYTRLNKSRMSQHLKVVDFCNKEGIDVAIYNKAKQAYTNRQRMANFKIKLDPPEVIKKRYEGFSYKTGIRKVEA